MPHWESYKGCNGSPHPYNQLINHDVAMQRVRGGPSKSYTHLMCDEEPLHLTRTDEVTGCRWEPGELPHEGHDPQHCPYFIREGKRGGDAPLSALAREGDWENDGRDEWEKLVLRPTERSGEESEDDCEKIHPGTKRGESLVNEAFEDRLIRHAQGKSVRVLGLEDDRMRSSPGAVNDQTLRGDKKDSSGEESLGAVRPPLERYHDDSGKKSGHEESGLEKFMTKIKGGLKTPSPSSRPGSPSHHNEEQRGLMQAMANMHEGLSSSAPSERHHLLSPSPEASTMVEEDEKRRARKSAETLLFAHDNEGPKRSRKSLGSIREALASTPTHKHHARPENHYHHKQMEEESGFGKVMSKIKEGFEHTLMGREATGIFDLRFWEKKEELDNLNRTAKRDRKEMKEVKKEGEG